MTAYNLLSCHESECDAIDYIFLKRYFFDRNWTNKRVYSTSLDQDHERLFFFNKLH